MADLQREHFYRSTTSFFPKEAQVTLSWVLETRRPVREETEKG
jgi:hypothetical protein